MTTEFDSGPLLDGLEQTVRALLDERRYLRMVVRHYTDTVVPELQQRLNAASETINQLLAEQCST
jgi:hypothetical protein